MNDPENTPKSPNKRTIRRWKREGAPTNDPEKLAVWVIAHGKKAGSSAPQVAPVADNPVNEDGNVPVADELVKELGLLGAAERLRRLERHHYQNLVEAEKRGDLPEAAARSKLHADAVEGLRLTEKAAFELEALKGKYILLSDAETEVARMNLDAKQLLIKKFESELPPEVVGLNAAEIQIRCKAMIREVCEVLSDTPSKSDG